MFWKFINTFGLLTLTVSSVMFNGCKSDDAAIDPPTQYEVSFTVGSDTVSYVDGEANYGNGPGIHTYADSVGRLHSQYTTYIRSALDPSFETEILTIQSVRYFSDTLMPDYNSEFMLFATGQYGFGAYNEERSNLGTDGIIITYTDADGKIWSSDVQFGTQESWAQAEITAHLAVDVPQFGATTKGRFDCRVFDGTGEHLDLRNGTFTARTIFFNP